MKRTIIRTLATAALVLAASVPSRATHLVGGNLGYVYQGETAPGSGVYRYQVNLEFYMNCGTGSNFTSLYALLGQDYGTPLFVGAYLQDPLDPNADKVKLQDIPVQLVDSLVIEPDLPDNCAVGQGLCTVKGIFSGFVDVPLNFGGVHLYYHMCCRNLGIANINNPNSTGIGYYAFVPPPLVNNSSPVFLGQPTPFLCIGDTATFLNTANDPDGDLLIFSFEVPYNSQNFGGGIIPPPPFLNWPVGGVNYNAGFSLSQPFGAGGYAFINGATGLTSYMAPLQGNYVVAVEVKEYRNGQLIGRVRRDLQLQAIPCPPNATPAASAPIAASYTVQAGDQLCLDLSFADADGDSLLLQAAGTIFDGTLVNPTATISGPVLGSGTLGTQFCWDTSCEQGQGQPYLFSVSVTDNGCPPLTVDVVVQVQVVPFAADGPISGPTSVCSNTNGAAYGLPAGSGSTYAWSVGGGIITGGDGTNSITVDWGNPGSGTVSVVVSDSLGCSSAPLDLNVSINGLPFANAGADAVICAGGSVTLGGAPTGPPGSTYAWSPSTGLSSTNVADPVASPASTTTYIVQVTNAGCVITDTVVVSVSQPQLDAGPDTGVCLGDSVQLNATGSGSFAWIPANSLSDASTEDPLAFPTATTNYSVTLTDTAGCTTTDQVLVTVSQPVNAGTDGSITVCSDAAQVDLAMLLGGSPDPGGAWSPSANYTPGGGGGVFTYVVAAQSPCPTDTAFVTVSEVTALTAGSNATEALCSSAPSTDLLSLLGGTPDPGGLWTDPDGAASNGQFDPLQWPAGGTFTYVVDGIAPCQGDTATVAISISPAPNPGGPGFATLCSSGDPFSLLDSLSGIPDGPGTWTGPNNAPHASVYDPAVDVPGVYTYTIPAQGGCAAASATVTVSEQAPSANAGADVALCAGDTVQLGGSGGIAYAWTPGAGLSATDVADPLATPTTTATYTLTVTDAQGCTASDAVTVTVNDVPTADAGPDASICAGEPVTLGGTPTAPPGSAILWSPNTGLNDPAIGNPTAQPTSTTTYTVTVENSAGCVSVDSVGVTVNPLPVVSAGNDTSICAGAGVQLNGSGGGSYLWTPDTGLDDATAEDPIASPTTTTTYTLTVTDANQCSASDEVTVGVDPLPTADAGPDVWVCPGFDVLLQGSGGTTYNWSPTTGLSDAAIADPLAAPGATTTYTLTVTDASGCSGTDQVTVTVNDDPPVDAGPDRSACAGTPVVLGGSPSSLPGSTYLWIPATGLDDPSSPNPTATPGATTIYTLVVTNDTCTAQDQVLVTVAGEAQAAFTVRLEPRCDGLRAYVTDLSEGAVDWAWSFSDGSTSIDPEPAPILPYGGDLTITLTVTDAQGCTASITQNYPAGALEDHTDITMPNIFTPNADGNNDLFGPITDAELGGCLQMSIFNRWGQKMWESFGNATRWDGRTFAGEPAVVGTYFYVIDLNGIRYEGNIQLAR